MADDGRTLAQRVRDRYPGAYESLSDQELEGAMLRKYPGAYDDLPKSPYTTAKTEDFVDAEQTPNVFTQGAGTSIVQGAVGAGKNIAGIVPGLIHTVMNPLEAGKEMIRSLGDTFDKGDDTSKSMVERGAYRVAGSIPFLGPLMASAGEQIGSGDPEQMGAGVVNAALSMAPARAGRRVDTALRRTTGPQSAFTSASSAVEAGADTAGRAVSAGGRAVADTAKTVAKHPATKIATGAGLGYAHGGLLGALEGAVGGSILARI